MKREIKLSAAIDRLLKFGPDMAEQDRVALENAIVGEFEDILPTYKGVKDDGVSRLYEYAARNNIGSTPVEEVVEEEVKAVEPSPVIAKVLREFEEQQAAAPVEAEAVVEVVVEEAPKPKTPRAHKPRAKKVTPSE